MISSNSPEEKPNKKYSDIIHEFISKLIEDEEDLDEETLKKIEDNFFDLL